MLTTREHYDLLEAFERIYRHHRLDREPKELWAKGVVYQNGETNALFLAYRHGYALAKSLYDGAAA